LRNKRVYGDEKSKIKKKMVLFFLFIFVLFYFIYLRDRLDLRALAGDLERERRRGILIKVLIYIGFQKFKNK